MHAHVNWTITATHLLQEVVLDMTWLSIPVCGLQDDVSQEPHETWVAACQLYSFLTCCGLSCLYLDTLG